MIKIWGVRGGMIGDSIMALPVLNALEKIFPGSYKYWVLHKRSSQGAQLYLNHPLVDKIHITEFTEDIGKKDFEIMRSCNLTLNVKPEHPEYDDSWYNKYTCCEETFRMTGLNFQLYKSLDEKEKKPRLYQWFDVENKKDTIGIWPFAAYGKKSGRSPSEDWWKNLLIELSKKYKIIHFGHFSEPKLNCENYVNLTHLSFFEQIKIAIGCRVNINTDSGSGWVIGAYGVPQISLLSMAGLPYQTTNIHCLAPENYNNNNKLIFSHTSCDNIQKELVLDAIDEISSTNR